MSKIKCNSCGKTDKWQPIGELKVFLDGTSTHGYYEQFRCSNCGQVRTQTIRVVNEQPKGVVL